MEKKRDHYVFPAVLTYEDGFEIAVTFPDFPGCATSGKNEEDAIRMGKDALGGHLWCMEQEGEAIPEPSCVRNLKLDGNEVPVFIEVSMNTVRLAQENKSVNRTVTLPAWMNAAAIEKGVNFSQVLQKALIDDYGLHR